MTSLMNYGWSEFQQQYLNSSTSLQPGRIVSIKGFKYFIVSENGELETELSGKLLYENDHEHLPKVGDWITFINYDTMGYIVELIPRKNFLSRKNPGNKMEKQILAANIDYAVIVQGLDRDFNLMRLDRYIVQIMGCGIKPVIVLNKADLVDNTQDFLLEVDRLQRDCPVYFCSSVAMTGIKELSTNVFLPGKTCILIGSSGVGKSSLLNCLMQTPQQVTGEISDANSKGRHTTTTRDLFMIPNGSLIIDTPGMREFGVTGEDSAIEDEGFPQIKTLSENCRYSDCRHLNESGCAVLDALSTGSLDQLVYDSYVKLIREQRRFQVSVHEKKQQAKQSGRMAREATNHRKKNKF